MAYTGGCACGAVRYEAVAEPAFQAHCQCRMCQKGSGTGHSAVMGFPKAALTVKGKLSSWSYKADSGNTATHYFCPTCGAPIYLESGGPVSVVTVGSLDDPGAFKPSVVVYASGGHAWDTLDPKLRRFDKMPPSQ
jgi:hypothetical protein